ncbi:MAG: 4-hydroxy-tetrahydrodipicolinate reductase [Pseudomonadota bacterium]|nr:4-hydroxy-tetrahydrodipicolinate reductase [Pseudomonadota bacterium]
MRIGIAGVSGRMGRLLAEETLAAGHTLVGGTSLDNTAPDGVTLMDLPALAAETDAIIDFTHADAVQRTAETLAAAGGAWILGTTGLSADDEASVDRAATRIGVVYAANFGPGVNLLLAIARQLGAALPAELYDAEIVEMHHRQKVDAPSGTAVALGRAVAEGRGVALADVMQSGRDGHTGPRPPGAIGFAALRGGQVVGEHTVLFAAAGEHISITHRAIDRRAFATGAVRAAGWIHGRTAGRYDMADVMRPM